MARRAIFAFPLILATIGLHTSSAHTQTSSVIHRFDYEVFGSGSVSFNQEKYFSGPSSLKSTPSADSSGMGGLIGSFNSSSGGEMSIRFYDDMGGCSSSVSKAQLAGIQVRLESQSSRSVGVFTDHSACNYITRSGAIFSTTTVARTLGWHHIRLVWGFNQISTYVDETQVTSGSYTYKPNAAFFGDFWGSSVGAGPAWYDDLIITTLSK
ncbi:hypothetical protein WME99_23485 [Sorangium sp. So ce136]|uniref:hypothetical protein n=1 Tax=Sorangium sp. So ce136 TaxID=3133284 RepID=UPI003F1062D6